MCTEYHTRFEAGYLLFSRKLQLQLQRNGSDPRGAETVCWIPQFAVSFALALFFGELC